MPERETLERAKRDKREGKSASTQAGEFVREEMHHVKEGKHGAKNRKQAIAIGLSKARSSGVKLKAKGGSRKTRQGAKSALRRGRKGPVSRVKARGRVSAKRRAAGRKGGRAAARSRRSQRSRNARVK